MKDFMKMSESIKKAYLIAKEAHKGQKDKAGKDYIYHPMFVASNVGNDENAIIVALLHDVVEDTDITLADLSKDFPDNIIRALDCVTHKKNEPYMDYVIRCSKNPIAKKVKLADLKNNMDLSRLPNITQKDIDRLEKKYKPAYEYLTGRKFMEV